jgi:hypothetical protein
MAAHQVAVDGEASGKFRIRLGPSSLDEERGRHLQPPKAVDQLPRRLSVTRAIGMLGVEGEGHPESGPYFSTPLMTMPRVKKRWNTMKRSTGITSVIRVPAWMSAGLR